MGIVKFLRAGHLNIDPVLRQLRIGNSLHILPYDKIDPDDWGYVYEKFVGQSLEGDGYKVHYNGFSGFRDRGIDLIAEIEKKTFYLQCKFLQKTLGKSQINHILFNASKLLFEEYERGKRNMVFALVVQSKNKNFSKKTTGSVLRKKVSSPWLDYFLSHNHTQSKVKLEVWELPMGL